MPRSSSATDKHVVKVFQDNVPGKLAEELAKQFGWIMVSVNKDVLQMWCNKPKAIGEMAALHELKGRQL
eukprot:6197222-Pleurochrysis_carterae.AAC.3